MKSTIRQHTIFGIIAFVAIMAFSLTSCQQVGGGGGGGGGGGDPTYELDSKLTGTTWEHSNSGDKIHFPDNKTLEITLSGQSNKTSYTLKYTQEIAQLNEFQYRFEDKDSPDKVITYNSANDQVKSVMFDIIASNNRVNNWVKSNGNIIGNHSFTVSGYNKIQFGGAGSDPVAVIIGYTGDGGNIVIPSKLKVNSNLTWFQNNYPDYVGVDLEVWSITTDTFRNKNVTSITFPSTLKRITGEILNYNPLFNEIKIGSNVRFLYEENGVTGFCIDADFDALYRGNGRLAGTYRKSGNTWSYISP